MELVASETEEYLFLSAASGQRHVRHDEILNDQPRGSIVAVTKVTMVVPGAFSEGPGIGTSPFGTKET